MLEKHWYRKERFEISLRGKDYIDFKHCVIRGAVSHRTLAAIMGEEQLSEKNHGWNIGEWNWNTMKVFFRENNTRDVSQDIS